MLMNNSQKSYKHNKIIILYITGAVFLIAAALFGFAVGSVKISISDIFDIITGNANDTARRIFLFARFPRTVACLVCGAALAVSGAVIQCVLSNNLASPSIIGVNSGAGLAVTICTALGIYGGLSFTLFSFIGALFAATLICIGAKKWSSSRSSVILIGVALNSLFNAISDAIITFNPEISIMSRDFKVGEFSGITYDRLIPAVVFTAVALLVLLTLTTELDILSLGTENAKGLGLRVGGIRILFIILSSLLAGTAVSLAGLLSFIGLIVPHAVKLTGVTKASHLLPLCAIYGAGFTVLCDTLARVLFSPYEIPVGIIMSFLGVPFFVFILVKRKGGLYD